MAPTFQEAQDAVAGLVKHFRTNRAAFLAPDYKEAHARQELIDPLFIALGWDVYNAGQAAPDYREVVLEDTLEIAGQKKAPDYAFRLGRERKFFAEAKKPGVDLKTDSGPAYQLRRYAWSAKLPLSLLTDFEEFAVYDCRSRPSEKDKAATARTNFYSFEEYPDQWREIWDVFSREAVWGGSFDQFAASVKGKRGATEVDAEFLKEIEGWRDSLAKNIALRNTALTIDELNDAVQRTIDRIIFLRMAEDRKMEEYERLSKLAERGNIYAEFIRLCRAADAKYNSGLFDFAADKLTPRLAVDDKALKPILAGLYFPQSPYEFSVLPVEILGNVYEQFLGKVIRLTAAHQAKVEEKPEVKKAGGVYYTPSYIVDYIVKNTVGKLVEGKGPKELKEFRALDPACGSGSFLLGAYQYLLDHYLQWYATHEPEKYPKAVYRVGPNPPAPFREREGGANPLVREDGANLPEREGGAKLPSPFRGGDGGGVWRLTTAEKKRILTAHIFGVDIDRQAVEVTKLSLLLKVLEGESDQTIGQLALLQERALPNLDNNIKCGNSLIGPDYFAGQLIPDADELRRVNPFDWESEFPAVFNRHGGENAKGFDCVIGNPPYGAELSDGVKVYIQEKFKNESRSYDTYELFLLIAGRLLRHDGRVSMIIPASWLTGEKYEASRRKLVNELYPAVAYAMPFDVFEDAYIDTAIVVFTSAEAENCLIHFFPKKKHLTSVPEGIGKQVPIKNIREDAQCRLSLILSEESAPLLKKVHAPQTKFGDGLEISRGVQPYSRSKHTEEQIAARFLHAASKKSKLYLPELQGNELSRYYIAPERTSYLKYGDDIASTRPMRMFEGKRIVLRRLLTRKFRLQASLATETLITTDNVLNMIPRTGNASVEFALGILNSKLISWIYVNTSMIAQKDDFPQVHISALSAISLPEYSQAQHDRMVTLVAQMLELHKQKAAGNNAPVERLIEATDREIDKLVYELYGLTEEQVRVVENR